MPHMCRVRHSAMFTPVVTMCWAQVIELEAICGELRADIERWHTLASLRESNACLISCL